MKIAQTYSHLNGEEYLIVHHSNLYQEIKDVIASVDAETHRTKESKEKRKGGRQLISPIDLNQAFKEQFQNLGWHERRYSYYLTLDRQLMQQTLPMPASEQRTFLQAQGVTNPLYSFNQTDFVKDQIAIEVQFGKYAFVAYDLFVKHMMFFSGGVINLGIEILPTKKMANEMSSGIGYFESEVYNVLRHGRGNPPVPLLVLGIEP